MSALLSIVLQQNEGFPIGLALFVGLLLLVIGALVWLMRSDPDKKEK